MLSASTPRGLSNERHLNTDDIVTSVSNDAPRPENQEILESNTIQNWIVSLPEERLSESMIIRDDSFVSTILELHSSLFIPTSPTQLEEGKPLFDSFD
jgi:dihydrofolate reductase